MAPDRPYKTYLDQRCVVTKIGGNFKTHGGFYVDCRWLPILYLPFVEEIANSFQIFFDFHYFMILYARGLVV